MSDIEDKREDLLKSIDAFEGRRLEIYRNMKSGEIDPDMAFRLVNADKKALLQSIEAEAIRREREGEIRGMKVAKSRVLRRTEIPKGAKNPTRDYIVVLGEDIAAIIDKDILELKKHL